MLFILIIFSHNLFNANQIHKLVETFVLFEDAQCSMMACLLLVVHVCHCALKESPTHTNKYLEFPSSSKWYSTLMSKPNFRKVVFFRRLLKKYFQLYIIVQCLLTIKFIYSYFPRQLTVAIYLRVCTEK